MNMTLVSRTVGKCTLVIKQNLPTIMVVGGIVGGSVAAVLACKATLKVEDIIDEHKEMVDKIKEGREKFDEEKYTKKDYQKDLTTQYLKTALEVTKLYGPSVALGGLSVASILTGYNILSKRNLALMASFTALDESFKKYRARVASEFGADVEERLYNGKVKENVVVNEDGTQTTEYVYEGSLSIYSKLFDSTCNGWDENPEYSRMRIEGTRKMFEDQLAVRGHVLLNDVYDAFNIERTSAGAIVGWVFNPDGLNIIDFGVESAVNSRFVNGLEQNCWLDFNVDGVIYDKI